MEVSKLDKKNFKKLWKFPLIIGALLLTLFAFEDLEAHAYSTVGGGDSDRYSYFYVGAGYGYMDYYTQWNARARYTYRTEMDLHESRVAYQFAAPYSAKLEYSHIFTDTSNGSSLGSYNRYRYDGRYFTDWIAPAYTHSSASSDHRTKRTNASGSIRDRHVLQVYVNNNGWAYAGSTTHYYTIR